MFYETYLTFFLIFISIVTILIICAFSKRMPLLVKMLFPISIVLQILWYFFIPKPYDRMFIFLDETGYYTQLQSLVITDFHQIFDPVFWMKTFGSAHILGPIYLLILYKLFLTPVNVSIFNIFISKLAILVWYPVLEEFLDKKKANIILIILAFSPIIWVYNSCALRDTLLFMLVSISLFFCWKYYSQFKVRYLLWAVVFSFLIIFTRIYLGAFTLLCCIGIAILRSSKSSRISRFIPVILTACIIIFSFVNIYWSTAVQTMSETSVSSIKSIPEVIVSTMFGPYIWRIDEIIKINDISQAVMSVEALFRLITFPIAIVGVLNIFFDRKRALFGFMLIGNFILNLIVLGFTFEEAVWRQVMPVYPVVIMFIINGLFLFRKSKVTIKANEF